ncbi:MAG: hypothetical protein R6V58_15350 [Planctomycetota bacterium]
MSLGYKGKLGLLVAGQATAVLLVVLLVFLPSTRSVRQRSAEIDELSEHQAELSRMLEKNPDPVQEMVRIKAEMRRLDDRMPPESRISWLSARIADAAREHDVDIRSASHWTDGGRATDIPELKRMRKTVTVRCPARNLYEFLQAMNKLPFAVIVEDLSVRREEQGGTVSATVDLATFVLRLGAVGSDQG